MKCVNNQISERDVCNYGSEWENDEVCELMSEELNLYVSEYVNNLRGKEVHRERASERASLMYGRQKLLSSAIIHHDIIWYSMIPSVKLIWTSICVYVVCAPF